MTKRAKAAPGSRVREIEDRFIELWGEISALWGVNRSLGRIQATLYLSEEPMHAEALKERLQISHGNVSTSIRDLLAWGVIRKVHLPAERKAHYEAEQDPWTWFHTCIRERRRREIVPVMESLHQTLAAGQEALREARGEERARLLHVNGHIDRFVDFSDEFLDLIDVFLNLGAGRMGKLFRSVARKMPKGDRA